MLEQQAAVGNLVGHAPCVHVSLQVPALAVLHGSGAEVKVGELTHFSQLTPGRTAGRPGPRTAWALWRERQIVILLLVLTGTMLCCDAWFDVGTGSRPEDRPSQN